MVMIDPAHTIAFRSLLFLHKKTARAAKSGKSIRLENKNIDTGDPFRGYTLHDYK